MAKPKIRFKGYQEDWEQRKLGEVAKEFKSGNSLKVDEIGITGDYPVYGGNGLRGYTSTYNHDGEFALIGRQGALCGNMNYSVGKAYFTEHAVVVKADENNDTKFMYYMLDTMNLGQYSDQSAQPGLAVNKLVKLENLFPQKEEQQRIGLYFSNVDHLITLHQRKCDQTKKLKKFMLQKMFPQNGKKVPELRFSEFTDDWEQRKLGEFGKTTGGTSIESEFNELGKYKVISIGSYSETSKYNDQGIRANKTNKTESRILNKNNLTMILNDKTASGNIIGRVLLIDADDSYVFNQRTERIEVYENEYLPEFLYHFLNADNIREKIIRAAQGNTQIYVNWNSISELSYKIPLSKHEQRKIADLFNQLDNLITLHQRKYEELQKVKKFMLQNMFV